LGRIQVETGRRDQGVKNLTKAAELREKAQPTPANRDTTAAAAQQRLSDAQPMPTEEPRSNLPPEQQKKLEAYFDHLRPAIGVAYNNLGVAAGSHNDFTGAMSYFRKAGEWYPALETLDRNLGMAAFHAGSYQDAILPLWHALQRDPNDDRVRAALGLSYFLVRNYRGTIETLRPIEKLVSADPGAGSAYAMSLIKTGEYEKGMGLLKSLVNANPNIADLHANLGETYAEQGIYANAVEEYRKSLALNPAQPRVHSLLGFALLRDGKAEQAVTELRPAAQAKAADPATRYYLALALLQSSKKDEAMSLLRQVIAESPKYADAYYQIGKLELEGGNTTQAITNLESAAALSPKSDYIHYQLSLAYGRDSRTEDAQREMQLYQALKTERRGNHEQAQSN
jgi:tetratricopeptide (TPR) repeat protein